MKIVPNQRFIHDRQAYEKDQEYDVSEELGQYFENVGWVGDDKEKANDNHNRLAADLGLPTAAPDDTEAVVSELERTISNLRLRKETGVKLG